MKIQKAISSFLLISFLSSIANAQQVEQLPKIETPQGEVDPGEAISPMRMNQRAAFTGVLLAPKALTTVIARLKSIDDRVKLASEEAKETAEEVCRHEKELTSIRVEADKNILKARIEDNERNLSTYEKRITQVQESQPNSALLVGLGALGGIAVATLTIFAAQSITK